jgi:hypothetical protein
MKALIEQQIRYNNQIASGKPAQKEEVVITTAIRKKAGRPRTKLPTDSDKSNGFSQVQP